MAFLIRRLGATVFGKDGGDFEGLEDSFQLRYRPRGHFRPGEFRKERRQRSSSQRSNFCILLLLINLFILPDRSLVNGANLTFKNERHSFEYAVRNHDKAPPTPDDGHVTDAIFREEAAGKIGDKLGTSEIASISSGGKSEYPAPKFVVPVHRVLWDKVTNSEQAGNV